MIQLFALCQPQKRYFFTERMQENVLPEQLMSSEKKNTNWFFSFSFWCQQPACVADFPPEAVRALIFHHHWRICSETVLISECHCNLIPGWAAREAIFSSAIKAIMKLAVKRTSLLQEAGGSVKYWIGWMCGQRHRKVTFQCSVNNNNKVP